MDTKYCRKRLLQARYVMQNDMFNYDPYEALIRMDQRLEYCEHQIATAHALAEKQHRELQRLHKMIVDIQTVTLHHAHTLKETQDG